MNYQERLDFVNRLALEAGQLTLKGFGRCGQMPKDGTEEYDISTEYDLRTEEMVRTRILQMGDEPVLGEEDGLLGDPAAARDRLWIVDPIDGTLNYQRGLPLYGVSIAYCAQGMPACGAIYLPVLGQLFYAARGTGAFLVERDAPDPVPIHVGRERELARLVIGLAGKGSYQLMAACAAAGIPRRSLRYSMCAVMNLAYIASGRMDVYLHTGIHLWDCAAGDLILQEAGGPPAIDYAGTPIFPEYVNRRLDLDVADRFPMIVVSSQELMEEPAGRILSAAGFQLGKG